MVKGIFILGYLKIDGYNYRHYTPYIDTGSAINICRKNTFPEELWKPTKLRVRGFNNKETILNWKIEDACLEFNFFRTKIGDIYAYELESKNILLGMPFISRYIPVSITDHYLLLTTPCETYSRKIRCKRTINRFYLDEPWIKGPVSDRQKLQFKLMKLDVIESFPFIWEVSCMDQIYRSLERSYGTNPLDSWHKHKTEVEIKLIDKNSIVYKEPWNQSPEEQKCLQEHIDDYLAKGYIELSNSKHSSPAFVVPKANGKTRMVIDYTVLNDKTVSFPYPQPDRIMCLKRILGYNYFSKFDCTSGFHHLKLTKESRPLTAFSIPNGFYQFVVLPFGYKNAPRRYQAFMDKIFNPYRDFLIVYIDDILVFSKTKEEHINHLNIFCDVAYNNGIMLSKEKCEIMKNQISFLGTMIDKQGIKLPSIILSKIINFDENIDTKKKIKSFLGIINQLRDYIPHLSQKIEKLFDKTKKDLEFTWTDQDRILIQQIKKYCSQFKELKLCYPEDDRNFTWIIESDASDTGFGAVLKFVYTADKAREFICRFYSGKWNKNGELNWEINKKELKALEKAILHFEPYIIGKKFIIRTDNSQVKYWITGKKRKDSITFRTINRMIINIQLFDFDVQLIRTNENALADRYSRT